MKALVLGFVEAYSISVAIDFSEHGYHWTGYAIGIAAMLLAYTDGRLRWSE